MPFPNIDPIAFAVGPFAVRWYALAYLGGVLLGALYARALLSRKSLWHKGTPPFAPQAIFDFAFWAVLGIVVGGRVGYVLFYNLAFYAANPLEAFALWDGGMSFHGGLIGICLAMIGFTWSKKGNVLSGLDLLGCVATIGLLLGRLANFINAELYGSPTSLPWGVVFPTDPEQVSRHPTQLYEGLLEGVLLFLIIRLVTHVGYGLRRPGLVAGIFGIGYALSRIFVELFRLPDAQIGYLYGGWLTMGQVLSLPILLLGLVLVALRGGCIVADKTRLAQTLANQIRTGGPISVASFMGMSLTAPGQGYYQTAAAIGAKGDFITAPEISQMFGELIGFFFVDLWQQGGQPTPFTLLELGPGRATLMSDMLRVAAKAPGFVEALDLALFETHPELSAQQRQRLEKYRPRWISSFDLAEGQGPIFVVANEFFDALPIRQFVKRDGAWHERVVGLDAHDDLAWGLSPTPVPNAAMPEGVQEAEDGAVYEAALAGAQVMARLAEAVAARGGAILVIDYGYAHTQVGETLQAVKRHAYAEVLADPGEADLSAHVDFDVLGQTARAAGLVTPKLAQQGDFLVALGIKARARALQAANPAAAEAVEAAMHRLIADDQMGHLFKVFCAYSQDFSHVAFEP